MSSHDGHRKRLRGRLADAPEKLADYEILELMLGYALPRRDTRPLAEELLRRFTSFRGLFGARPGEYLDIPGIGEGVTGFFALLREFLARYAEEPVRARIELCTPEAVAAMARERLGKLPHEEIWLAFVDGRNRLIRWEKAAKGTVDASTIHPREVLERALALKASGLIVVHNHPGGDPRPSGSDLAVTRNLEQAARPLRIRIVDHVVVTENECYSLKKENML